MNKARCACGNTMTAGTTRNPTQYCADCTYEMRSIARAWRMQALYEVWHAGMSLNEIAAKLGCARGTVGSNLSRMRGEGWDVPCRTGRPVASVTRLLKTPRDTSHRCRGCQAHMPIATPERLCGFCIAEREGLAA